MGTVLCFGDAFAPSYLQGAGPQGQCRQCTHAMHLDPSHPWKTEAAAAGGCRCRCRCGKRVEALFSSQKLLVRSTVALSFLFDKYCRIME